MASSKGPLKRKHRLALTVGSTVFSLIVIEGLFHLSPLPSPTACSRPAPTLASSISLADKVMNARLNSRCKSRSTAEAFGIRSIRMTNLQMSTGS